MPAARCLCPACPSTTHHRIPRGWELIASDGVHVTLSNGSVGAFGRFTKRSLASRLARRGAKQCAERKSDRSGSNRIVPVCLRWSRCCLLVSLRYAPKAPASLLLGAAAIVAVRWRSHHPLHATIPCDSSIAAQGGLWRQLPLHYILKPRFVGQNFATGVATKKN